MRADGKRVVSEDPIYEVICHIMPKRSDASNMIEVNIPLEPMNQYVREKKAEGIHITHLSLVIAAYLRAAAHFPFINRFVMNKRLYARREFAVSMVVLKSDSDEGTINKLYFRYEDTIFDVQNKLESYITTNRAAGPTNKTDKTARTLLRIPGLLRFGVSLFRFLDKHNLLPYSVIKASPFHCSLLITNLASIRTNHIFHHCYDFGTTSVAAALGIPREIPTNGLDGIQFNRCLPIGIVMDERICSGSYYARFFRLFRHYISHPHEMETPLEDPIYETEFRQG